MRIYLCATGCLAIFSSVFNGTGNLGICAGFFTIHSAAVGAFNRKLSSGQGRANALYVLFYYTGDWMGINGAGFDYEKGGWAMLVTLLMLLLVIPIAAGIVERGTTTRDAGP